MNLPAPHILLINPWVHDFAAFDFWAKPLGLLRLAAMLRVLGLKMSYLDCLDRFHPKAPTSDPAARYGRGPYLKTPLPPPPGLEKIPRRFSRYGIKPEWFREDLARLKAPDLILVTSMMTYWYPGVQETICVLREMFPQTPLVLGGIYATLCRDHAKTHSGADIIISGPGESKIVGLVQEVTGTTLPYPFDDQDLDSYPYPAYDLQTRVNYIPIATSQGCPFSCAYCASGKIQPRFRRRKTGAVVEELLYWHRTFKVQDVAFYDDALLVDAPAHAQQIFKTVIDKRLPLRFHTPNALHIRNIDGETARLMFAAGFKTIRLGLETAGFEGRDTLDRKVTAREFRRAVDALKAAGFSANQVGAYLLTGLPDQRSQDLIQSIRIVREAGVTPILAHYTPIPHTPLWPQAVAASRYDLNADPIFTNNAIAPCQKSPFSWKTISDLKAQARLDPTR